MKWLMSENDSKIQRAGNVTLYYGVYQNIIVDYYTEKYVEWISYIILPAVAATSALFALSSIALILSLKINNRIYNYIITRSTLKALTSICLILVEDSICMYCKSNYYNTKFKLIYRTYVIGMTVDTITVMIALVEGLITFDRLYILLNRKNWITRMKQKYLIIGIIFFSIIMHIPEWFRFKLEHVEGDIYKRSLTKFADTYFYIIYYVVFVNFLKISYMIFYTVLVILVVINYRKFVAKKTRLQQKSVSKLAQNNNNITKLIILVGVVYALTLVLMVVSNVLGRVDEMTGTYNSTFILIKYTGYLLSTAHLGVGSVALLYYDNNIKKKLRRIFCCQQS